MKTKFIILLVFISNLTANSIDRKSILSISEKVFDWQLKHPTGVDLWEWEYGTFYSGVIDLYKIDPKAKYLKAMKDMGDKYNWSVKPRPYNADVMAITHMYLDLYSIVHKQKMIDKTVYCLDASFVREPKEPDVRQIGNQYWGSWWSWCDALFMAPPAFAKYAKISGQIKYLDKMDELWLSTYNYLYDKDEHLYFRDDKYFKQTTINGKKVFWSRGNGWVLGGLTKVLEVMPMNYPKRPFYENMFKEMAGKIKQLQLREGHWSSSLLDNSQFGGMESSGTAFFCYAFAYGINSGLLNRAEYEPAVMKAWEALVKNINKDGKLGFVQQVGESPDKVSLDDSEAYGSGAFLLAACEVSKLVPKDSKE